MCRSLSRMTYCTNCSVLSKSPGFGGSRTVAAGFGRVSHARSMIPDHAGSSVAVAQFAPARFEYRVQFRVRGGVASHGMTRGISPRPKAVGCTVVVRAMPYRGRRRASYQPTLDFALPP